MANPFLAEIRLFGGTFAPAQWAFCNGQLMQIRQNEALFSLLGNSFGGDGKSTFALPNLQDRVPMGQGQGPDLSPRTLGASGGDNTALITTASMAEHSHAPSAVSGSGNLASPDGGTWAQSSQRDKQFYPTQNVDMAPNLIENAGGSQVHENRAPFMAMNYIIALSGVYPK